MCKAIMLSGGVDSTALAVLYKYQFAFTVKYGQLCAEAEVRAASRIAERLGLQHCIIDAPIYGIGAGDLVGRPPSAARASNEYSEWFPFRNQLIATLTAIKGMEHGVQQLDFGTVKSDGIFADGRQDFFEALSFLMSLQEGGMKVHAPAIDMYSEELILNSGVGRDILGWTHSCHTSNFSCGRCRGCVRRKAVLAGLSLA